MDGREGGVTEGGGAAEGQRAVTRGIDGAPGLVQLDLAIRRRSGRPDILEGGAEAEVGGRPDGRRRTRRPDGGDDRGAAQEDHAAEEVVVRAGEVQRAGTILTQAGVTRAVIRDLGIDDDGATTTDFEGAGRGGDVVLDRLGRARCAEGEGRASEGFDRVTAAGGVDAQVAQPAVVTIGRAQEDLVAEHREGAARDVAATGDRQGLGVVDGDVVAQFQDGDGLVGAVFGVSQGRADGAEGEAVLEADGADELAVRADGDRTEGVGPSEDEAAAGRDREVVLAIGRGVGVAADDGEAVRGEVDVAADAEGLRAVDGDGAGARAGEVARAEVEGTGAAVGEAVGEVDQRAASDHDRAGAEVVDRQGGTAEGQRAGAERVVAIDTQALRAAGPGEGDFAGVGAVVAAELDVVGRAVQVELGRAGEVAVEDDRAAGGRHIDDVRGDRPQDARTRPGAGTAAEVAEVGAVLEREGRAGKAVAIGGEDRAARDRGGGVGGGVVILELDGARGDREVEVGDAAAQADLVGTDLGEGVGLADGGGDRAVGFRAFDAADVEATAVTTEGGVRGEGEVEEADLGGPAGGVGVDEGGVGAVAGAGQDDIQAAGAVINVAAVGIIKVEGRTGQDGDRRALTEGGVGAEGEATGGDGDATRVEAIALNRQRAGADLAEGEGRAAVVEVRGEGAGDVAGAEGQGGRGEAVVDDLEAAIARHEALRQAEAVEVEHARIEGERAGVGAKGAGGRVSGVGAEGEATRIDGGGAGVGVGARDGDLARAVDGEVTRAGDDVTEGRVVHAVQAQVGARGDADGTDDGASVTIGADVQRARGDEGAAGVRGGGPEGEGARAVLFQTELTGARVGVVHELTVEGTRAVAAVGVAADGEGAHAGGVVGDGAGQGGGVGDQRADDAALAIEVEETAVHLQLHAEVELVDPGAAELERAGVDGAGAAEGVDRPGGRLGEDDRARIDDDGDGVVVDGVGEGAEGQRAGAVLGDGAATRLGGEGEVTRAAHHEGAAAADPRQDLGRGRGRVDEGTLPAHAVTADRGEGLGDGLAVEVDGGAGGDGAARGGVAEGGRGAEAQEASFGDGRRAAVGVRPGEDDRAGRGGGADDEGVRAGEVGRNGEDRAAAAEAEVAAAVGEVGERRAEGRGRGRADHQAGEAPGIEVDRLAGVAGEGERAGRGLVEAIGGQPSGDGGEVAADLEGTEVGEFDRGDGNEGGDRGRVVGAERDDAGRRVDRGDGGIEAESGAGDAHADRELGGVDGRDRDGIDPGSAGGDGRADGRGERPGGEGQGTGVDGGDTGVGVRTSEHDGAAQGVATGGGITDRHRIGAGQDRGDRQGGGAAAELVTRGTRGERTRVGGVGRRTELQRRVGGETEGLSRIADQSERAGRGALEEAGSQPGGGVGVGARGVDGPGGEDADVVGGGNRGGQATLELEDAVLNAGVAGAAEADRPGEGDLAAAGRHRPGRGATDEAAAGGGDGVRDDDVVRAGEVDQRTGDGDGAGAQGAGRRDRQTVDAAVDEVAADVDVIGGDARGAGVGVVGEQVGVTRGVEAQVARAGDRLPELVGARGAGVAADGRGARQVKLTIDALGHAILGQGEGRVIGGVDRPALAGRQPVEVQVGARGQVEGLAGRSPEVGAELQQQRAGGDIKITRVGDRVGQAEFEDARPGLGQVEAPHVQQRAGGVVADVEAPFGGDGRVAREHHVAEEVGRVGVIDVAIDQGALAADAGPREHEALAGGGGGHGVGTLAGKVERGAVADVGGAGGRAEDEGIAEADEAGLDVDVAEEGGATVAGVGQRGAAGVVQDQATRTGEGLVEDELAIAREGHGAVTADTDGGRAEVGQVLEDDGALEDVGTAPRLGEAGLADGGEGLGARAILVHVQRGRVTRTQVAVEDEVVAGLRREVEHRVDGGAARDVVLDEGPVVVGGGHEAADRLGGTAEIEDRGEGAAGEGDQLSRVELRAARVVPPVGAHRHGDVGGAGAEHEVTADRRDERRRVGRGGQGDVAFRDDEVASDRVGAGKDQRARADLGQAEGAADRATVGQRHARIDAEVGGGGEGDAAVGREGVAGGGGEGAAVEREGGGRQVKRGGAEVGVGRDRQGAGGDGGATRVGVGAG